MNGTDGWPGPGEVRRLLVVVAHPDDESFALGALLDRYASGGAAVSVLCLTRGEASTLGTDAGDLATLRAEELEEAAGVLGLARVRMLGHPDGALADVGEALEEDVRAEVDAVAADAMLVFDPVDGVTGHPDHAAASRAAMAVGARLGTPVVGWALPEDVALRLREETGVGFAGHPRASLTEVTVDRDRQLAAVRCHRSQAVPGSVLWRRLELLGDRELVRVLVEGSAATGA